MKIHRNLWTETVRFFISFLTGKISWDIMKKTDIRI